MTLTLSDLRENIVQKNNLFNLVCDHSGNPSFSNDAPANDDAQKTKTKQKTNFVAKC